MADELLSEIFARRIRPLIVRIEASWHDPQRGTVGRKGTGFLAAREVEQAANRHYSAIVTAKHLLDSAPRTGTTWRFIRQDDQGEDHRSTILDDSSAGFTRIVRPSHPDHDVAAFLIDAVAQDGHPLFDEEADPVIQGMNQLPGPGTQIAWAGYPQVAEEVLRYPQLCYYQGAVSATINRSDRPTLYLVDGHIDKGVSGGPVWGRSTGPIGYVLLGAAVAYSHSADASLPGLCHVTPINHIMKYISKLVFHDESEVPAATVKNQ